MLTRKAGLTAAFAIWIFALGLITRNGLLVLGAVPIVIYVVLLRLLEPRPHLNVVLERSLSSGAVYEGEQAEISLRIRNDGPPLPALELLDTLPAGLEVTVGSNHAVMPIGRGEERTLVYSVRSAAFGSYSLGPVRLRSSDLARNAVEESRMESTESLWVYPEVRYLNRIAIKPHRPRYWPGETTTRRSGSGLDFYGIREYLPGEPIRRMNWKASSRRDRVLVNQYLDEAGGDIMLALDSRLASEVGPIDRSTLKHSTRAAATVAYRLLRDRNRVGLIGIGDNLVKVHPGFGRRQFDRILAGLLVLKVGDGWEMENLDKLFSLYFSKQTQILVISPLLDDKSYESVVRISNAGYNVVVISPSPIRLEAAPESSLEEKTAVELASLRRRTVLSTLRRYATVIDWDVTRPLGETVDRLEEPRHH